MNIIQVVFKRGFLRLIGSNNPIEIHDST